MRSISIVLRWQRWITRSGPSLETALARQYGCCLPEKGKWPMTIRALSEGRIRMDAILFATDFSPASYAASLYATALAEHFHSVLTLVHVFLPSQSAQEFEARAGAVSDQRKLVEQKLKLTMQALTPKGGMAKSLLLEGDPSVALAQEAGPSSGAL